MNRRQFLAAAALMGATSPSALAARPTPASLHHRTIPSSGERIPVIGMGTWITFNVGTHASLREARTRLLGTFFALGGGVVDSSPMYGSSEAVLGHALGQLDATDGLFAATKVWTPFPSFGESQMAESEQLWGGRRFDLMQIHNLLGWEGHLETLAQWKAEGRIRYIGITTSHGSRHDEMARIMRHEAIDFVQFTYNLIDREAESLLLPLAQERGLAVIINRPFRRGALIDRLDPHPLPPFAQALGCEHWAQLLLKFVVSHPAVTCAIPATSQLAHLHENMAAGSGEMPDPALRAALVRYLGTL